MSTHFEQGEYRVLQMGNEVGRLVAVDSPEVMEHWFLYYDVPAGGTCELKAAATYQAPSTRNMAARPHYVGEAQTIDWTFEFVGPVDPSTFDRGHYQERLVTKLSSSWPLVYLQAAEAGSALCLPEIPGQVIWDLGALLDSDGNEVGQIAVVGNVETWSLYDATYPHKYKAPSTTVGERTTYRLAWGPVNKTALKNFVVYVDGKLPIGP
jgi:hypothetical protein